MREVLTMASISAGSTSAPNLAADASRLVWCGVLTVTRLRLVRRAANAGSEGRFHRIRPGVVVCDQKRGKYRFRATLQFDPAEPRKMSGRNALE
jgi:hypothetical protein